MLIKHKKTLSKALKYFLNKEGTTELQLVFFIFLSAWPVFTITSNILP